MIWNQRTNADVEASLARFMEELAQEPLDEAPAFTPAEIWQKAELLRRWDAQRRAVAPIDVSERLHVGIGLAGALALLVWLSRQLPQAPASPTLTAAMITSVLLIVSAAAFALWAIASDDRM